MLSQRESMSGLMDSLYRFDGNSYRLYTLLKAFDTETLLYAMAKANGEKIRRLISTYFTQLKGNKIQIRGKDLLALGFKPGSVFKDIFESVLEARLNNLVKTKDDEIRYVKEKFLKG
jgi:tRNA nucleotidyltransferase (CCA-adding enzyme)